MNDINAKSNTYPFIEVVLYSEIVRPICRVNQSRFSRQIIMKRIATQTGMKDTKRGPMEPILEGRRWDRMEKEERHIQRHEELGDIRGRLYS